MEEFVRGHMADMPGKALEAKTPLRSGYYAYKLAVEMHEFADGIADEVIGMMQLWNYF